MAIGANEDQVLDVRVVSLLGTVDYVLELRRSLFRNLQAYCCSFATRESFARLVDGEAAKGILFLASAGLRARAIGYSLTDRSIVGLLFRREVIVGLTFFHEAPGCSPVLLDEGGLKVRAFVGIQTQPVHSFEDA